MRGKGRKPVSQQINIVQVKCPAPCPHRCSRSACMPKGKRAHCCKRKQARALHKPGKCWRRPARRHGCRHRYHSVKEKEIIRPAPIVSEIARGRIFQLCNGDRKTYFEAIGFVPSAAVVRVDNDTASPMQATIERWNGEPIEFVVEQGQQISVAAPSIKALSIASTGEGGISKGFYRIQLHRNIG